MTPPTRSANEYASLALEVGGRRVPTVRDGSGADVAVLDIPSTGVTPYTIVIDLHKRPPSTSKQFNSLHACIHMGGVTTSVLGLPGASSLATTGLQGQRLGFAPVQVAEGGSECAANVDPIGDIQVDVMLATQGTSRTALPPSTTLPSAATKVAEGKKMFGVQTVSAGACHRKQVVGCEYGHVFASLRIKYARRMVLEMQRVLKPGAAVGGCRHQINCNAGQPAAVRGWCDELSVLTGKRNRCNAAAQSDEVEAPLVGFPVVRSKRQRTTNGSSQGRWPNPRELAVREQEGARMATIPECLGGDEKPNLDLMNRALDDDEEIVFCGMRGSCPGEQGTGDDDVVLLGVGR